MYSHGNATISHRKNCSYCQKKTFGLRRRPHCGWESSGHSLTLSSEIGWKRLHHSTSLSLSVSLAHLTSSSWYPPGQKSSPHVYAPSCIEASWPRPYSPTHPVTFVAACSSTSKQSGKQRTGAAQMYDAADHAPLDALTHSTTLPDHCCSVFCLLAPTLHIRWLRIHSELEEDY